MYPVHTILSLSGAHLPVLPLPPLSQLLQTLPSNSPLSYHSPCTHMGIEEEYLLSLSDRKQPKALISQSLFDKIYAALQNGSEDRGSTAQFRFWVRKIGLCNAPFALLLGPQGTYGQVRKGLSYLHPQAKQKPRPPLAVQLSAPLLSYLLSAPAPAPGAHVAQTVVMLVVTILSFALLYADTSDCLLSSIPHPFTGPLYFYDLISLTRSHLVASCPVRYDLPCTIRIYEPPIRLLVVLVKFRFPST